MIAPCSDVPHPILLTPWHHRSFRIFGHFSAAWRPGISRYPGIPSIVDNILLDATVYYILVVVCQLLLEFFLFLAPVGDT